MKAAQASSTAKLIAAATLLLDSEPHHAALVAPGAAALCRRMLSGSTRDRWLARSAVSPPTRLLWRALERCTLPGVIEHYWHRKRWIEQRCRAMLAQGFDRVLVLGAGFDTLALRLAAEFAQADLLEIDHPATQAAKRRALGSAAPRGVRFAALDLATQPLATALPGDSRATLVLIEGVLMYLAPARVDALFAALHACPAAQLRIAFSFVTRWPDGRAGFRPQSAWIARWLAWRGEPFVWALEPEGAAGFLQQRGWRLLELQTSLSDAPLRGENMALCERA